MYEVKVFDGMGNLKKVITAEDLEARSIARLRSMITERDRQQINSFEDETQFQEVNSQILC